MLHELLKAYRKNSRIKQWQLASLVGVKQGTICKWENGRFRPSPYLLSRLCYVLDIPPESIATAYLAYRTPKETEHEKKLLSDLQEYLNITIENGTLVLVKS